MKGQFAIDVDEGLSAPFKFLPSRYFYDDAGDRLFQQIMQMPEYYLTAAEHAIFQQHVAEIIEKLGYGRAPFDLVEFGAGDGYKTKIILRSAEANGANLRYVPIDISKDVLNELKVSLQAEFNSLDVLPINAEYFEALNQLNVGDPQPRLVMFIGSNIGNFTEVRTWNFLAQLFDALRPNDHVLLGYDLRKDPRVILNAYNDAAGITAQFNLNVLKRINRELGGNFELNSWQHYPMYDPQSGYARSYLVATKDQHVKIEATGKTYAVHEGECIHTEISRKYSVPQMEQLLQNNGFEISKHFFDPKKWYANTLAIRMKERPTTNESL